MTKMSPARRDGSEEGPGREEEGSSARAQRGTIGWVSLARAKQGDVLKY